MKRFPPVECFELTESVWDCNILERLIKENKGNILCFYFWTDNSEEYGWNIASANRYREIAEARPELVTKYYQTALCIWKPDLSKVHAYFSFDLRTCFDMDRREGHLVMDLLSKESPETLIIGGPSLKVHGNDDELDEQIRAMSNYAMAHFPFDKDVEYFLGP